MGTWMGVECPQGPGYPSSLRQCHYMLSVWLATEKNRSCGTAYSPVPFSEWGPMLLMKAVLRRKGSGVHDEGRCQYV